MVHKTASTPPQSRYTLKSTTLCVITYRLSVLACPLLRITVVNRLPDNGVSLYIIIQLTDSGCPCVTAKSTVATVYTLDGR